MISPCRQPAMHDTLLDPLRSMCNWPSNLGHWSDRRLPRPLGESTLWGPSGGAWIVLTNSLQPFPEEGTIGIRHNAKKGKPSPPPPPQKRELSRSDATNGDSVSSCCLQLSLVHPEQVRTLIVPGMWIERCTSPRHRTPLSRGGSVCALQRSS